MIGTERQMLKALRASSESLTTDSMTTVMMETMKYCCPSPRYYSRQLTSYLKMKVGQRTMMRTAEA